jgi:hypothetical protein
MDDTRGSGLEAYRDDPEYTSPEMEAHEHPDDDWNRDPDQRMTLAAGMSIGVGGGAAAGETMVENIETKH